MQSKPKGLVDQQSSPKSCAPGSIKSNKPLLLIPLPTPQKEAEQSRQNAKDKHKDLRKDRYRHGDKHSEIRSYIVEFHSALEAEGLDEAQVSRSSEVFLVREVYELLPDIHLVSHRSFVPSLTAMNVVADEDVEVGGESAG